VKYGAGRFENFVLRITVIMTKTYVDLILDYD